MTTPIPGALQVAGQRGPFPTQLPTMGDWVLVPTDPNTNNGANKGPALVVRVWEDGSLNVRIFGDSDGIERRSATEQVPQLPADDEPPGPMNRWAWPTS